jgi:putative nucleotidyltransferase with HDIG domain
MDRATANQVVEEHAKSESLRKHLLAVETCMRAYARKESGDEELWGITGLVHDFDWEVCPTPESHPTFGAEILRSHGFPEEIVRAVLSHGNHTGIPRETLMEKALFACDELSGFVTAVALVRPTKSLSDTKVSSVKRKMKDKAFAKSVSRDDIRQGAQELGVELDDMIAFIIEALKPVAPRLGLNE